MSRTRYYKVLGEGGATQYGGKFHYDLPTWKGPKHNGRWVPGKWMPVVENPVLCQRGYHACTREQLVGFLSYGIHIYVIELRGTIIHGDDKVVASEARLVEELPWGAAAARFFAVECAADVIHLANDERSIAALETAFEFACGSATPDELRAALGAAASAASAAWGAAWGAAASAESAAWGAAWGAAASAESAASAASAAWGAAWGAAASAESAAWGAAWGAARQHQTDRLMWWLGEDQ